MNEDLINFKCWSFDMTGDGLEDAVGLWASDAKEAAEVYVRRNYDKWEYPTEVEVSVMNSQGVIQDFTVLIERVPCFTAVAHDW